jgi:hypothetical protein
LRLSAFGRMCPAGPVLIFTLGNFPQAPHVDSTGLEFRRCSESGHVVGTHSRRIWATLFGTIVPVPGVSPRARGCGAEVLVPSFPVGPTRASNRHKKLEVPNGTSTDADKLAAEEKVPNRLRSKFRPELP